MMNTNNIKILPMPSIADLRFRKFAGELDFPLMVNIVAVSAEADKEDFAVTLESLKHDYQHLTNSDPYQDMIFAEIDGAPIAYSRVQWWQEEDPNDRIYAHFVKILPKWRRQGIEEAMIGWCENRLRQIARSHPEDSQRFFQTDSNDKNTCFAELIKDNGYKPIRYSISMSRPLEDIPQANLPDGIEVRPVDPKDIRRIWDASIEAFRDHWGFSMPKEEDFIGYKGSKYCQPELWQVAWKDNQVVGSILNYIDHDYNRKFDRKRGWTEEITTHRDWRRRGIARALIVRSMHMHKAKGMTEVALGVDTNNPTGALKLYQSLGYKKERSWTIYRKPL
jgi:ribosomal protein S18 acetylase RimI-like enzyme